MLVLTESATTVIRSLVDRPELPDTAGVRIASTHDGPGPLAVAPAGAPDAGDQVVEEQGARVFLEPTAAAMLEDQVLDATVDAEGGIKFVLAAQ